MTAIAAAPGASATGAALRQASERLAAAGCDSPRLDAELLLAQALGVDRASLVCDPVRPLHAAAARRFEAVLARREGHEPVAYIVGHKGFRHLDLTVDRRVLVPRPETELLVEAALAVPLGARVVDVGTGSGAVALALKHERPDLAVSATDTSPGALAVARANAAALGLEVAFRRADLLAGVQRPVDAVVANLPYVSDAELAALPPDVAGHEPLRALAGGPDGLDPIRRLVAQAPGIPFVALEVGFGQARAVRRLVEDSGWSAATLRDLAEIERVVVGRAR